MKKLSLFFYFIFIFVLSSCNYNSNSNINTNDEQTKKLKVVTTLFSQYDFVRNIVGDKADVSTIVPFENTGHNYDPSVNDIKVINEADLFIYTGKGMETWVDKILNNVTNSNLVVVDVSDGIQLKTVELEHDHSYDDDNHLHSVYEPHIWISIKNSIKIIENITQGLIYVDKDNENFYIQNRDNYINQLNNLDKEYEVLINNNKTIIFGGQFAFYYLFNDYNIKYISAFDVCSEESEPNPKVIANIISQIKNNNIKYIFREQYDSDKVANTIKNETGCEILTLNSCHTVSREEMQQGINYISIMKNNLETLKGVLLD